MNIRWIAVIRDVIILWVLTFLGGFIIGFTRLKGNEALVAIAMLSLAFMTAGFCLSGCLAKTNRFKHLFVVALALWLTSLVNVALGYTLFRQWLTSIVAVLLTMAAGGGLSLIFVRAPRPPETPGGPGEGR